MSLDDTLMTRKLCDQEMELSGLQGQVRELQRIIKQLEARIWNLELGLTGVGHE